MPIKKLMEGIKSMLLASVVTYLCVIVSVGAQVSTPCTTSMISSFTPCMNYVTGSSANGSTTPTRSCCDAVKSLMSTSVECTCLVITANIPIPFNRTLSLNLPRACKMTSGVPVKCKAAGSPLPAPGPVPVLLAPTSPSPAASPLISPQASKAAAAAPAPEDPSPSLLTPASSPSEADAPAANPRVRPVLTPLPASTSSSIQLPWILLLLLGLLNLNYFCFE